MRRISTATKSVDKFGAGKHGFTNGNAVAGIPATDLEDVWFDHVQEELCSIIEAAGIAVDGSARNQLLTALRSVGVFQTAQQFDVTTKVATMAALQRALGNFRGSVSVANASTLTADHLGKLVFPTGTITLPLLADVADGSALYLLNISGGIVTVNRQGADQITPNGSLLTNFQMGIGDDLLLIKKTGADLWVAAGGSARLKYASMFGASLATSGYRKLPSGDIEQWGNVSVPANSTATFSFPIAFTEQCYNIVASFSSPGASTVNARPISATQFEVQSTYTGGAQSAYWRAIGK